MAFSQVVKSYPQLASMNEDVPTSIGSDVRPRPIPSSVRSVSIASSNGSQTANGFNTFWLPSGSSAGIIKPYSMYLRFKVKVGTDVASTVVQFNGALKCASACIERLSLTMSNQQIEQINHFNVWHDILLANTTSKNFYDTDALIMEASYAGALSTGATAVSGMYYSPELEVVVPVLLSTFNNPKGVPLYLLNQALQIQVDWASISNSVKSTTNEVKSIQFSDAYIVYDQINVDEQYKNAVRMSMADPQNPKLYQLNIINVLGSNVSHQSTSITQNLGVNYSSLRGVVYTNIIDPATSLIERVQKENGQTNAKLLLDGVAINNYNIGSTAIIKAELDKTFGNLWDATMTFVGDKTFYIGTAFTAGISTTKFNDGANSFVGMPCQNLQLEVQSSGTANNKLYYFLMSDQAITIDAMGNVVMIR